MSTSPLVQVDELARLLADTATDLTDRPVVLDVRFRMDRATGRQEFEDAHIPGASYVDLNTGLATIRPDGVGGRHPMPNARAFTAAMRSAGVSMSRPVVAYDDWASLPASRLWWMLRHHGFLDVRVLDGGIAAWTAAGEPVESGPGTLQVGDFSPAGPGIGRVLDASEATSYAGRHLLLDARAADRFAGQNETIDAIAGHIPGAVNEPTLANVDSGGRFLPASELALRFRHLPLAGGGLESETTGTSGTTRTTESTGTTGMTRSRRVGTYCGSGVQAAHLALALTVAGITDDPDVYVGSWSDWINDPGRPIEV